MLFLAMRAMLLARLGHMRASVAVTPGAEVWRSASNLPMLARVLAVAFPSLFRALSHQDAFLRSILWLARKRRRTVRQLGTAILGRPCFLESVIFLPLLV